MTWVRSKDGYFTECETHTISRTCHGEHWVIALWDKQRKEYTAMRRAVTLEEQKRAVAELKAVADEPAVQVAV